MDTNHCGLEQECINNACIDKQDPCDLCSPEQVCYEDECLDVPNYCLPKCPTSTYCVSTAETGDECECTKEANGECQQSSCALPTVCYDEDGDGTGICAAQCMISPTCDPACDPQNEECKFVPQPDSSIISTCVEKPVEGVCGSGVHIQAPGGFCQACDAANPTCPAGMQCMEPGFGGIIPTAPCGQGMGFGGCSCMIGCQCDEQCPAGSGAAPLRFLPVAVPLKEKSFVFLSSSPGLITFDVTPTSQSCNVQSFCLSDDACAVEQFFSICDTDQKRCCDIFPPPASATVQYCSNETCELPLLPCQGVEYPICDERKSICCDIALACTPDCTNKACGDDGCGGSCGDCPQGDSCNAQFQCETCAPDCTGKACGDDGCGGDCGQCPAGETCNLTGQCEAVNCAIPCPVGLTCNANQLCETAAGDMECDPNIECGAILGCMLEGEFSQCDTASNLCCRPKTEPPLPECDANLVCDATTPCNDPNGVYTECDTLQSICCQTATTNPDCDPAIPCEEDPLTGSFTCSDPTYTTCDQLQGICCTGGGGTGTGLCGAEGFCECAGGGTFP
jgi:hypothetical protein